MRQPETAEVALAANVLPRHTYDGRGLLRRRTAFCQWSCRLLPSTHLLAPTIRETGYQGAGYRRLFGSTGACCALDSFISVLPAVCDNHLGNPRLAQSHWRSRYCLARRMMGVGCSGEAQPVDCRLLPYTQMSAPSHGAGCGSRFGSIGTCCALDI